ncbi:MAG: hypothetical protein RIR51_93 [Bacteroidota bacterium]|jgi:hypothetical protein
MQFLKKSLSITLMFWVLTIQTGFSFTLTNCLITGEKDFNLGSKTYCCGVEIESKSSNSHSSFDNSGCCKYAFLDAKMETDQIIQYTDFSIWSIYFSEIPLNDFHFNTSILEEKGFFIHEKFAGIPLKHNSRLAKLQVFLI